jgi:hypothetical protein
MMMVMVAVKDFYSLPAPSVELRVLTCVWFYCFSLWSEKFSLCLTHKKKQKKIFHQTHLEMLLNFFGRENFKLFEKIRNFKLLSCANKKHFYGPCRLFTRRHYTNTHTHGAQQKNEYLSEGKHKKKKNILNKLSLCFTSSMLT